MKHPFRTLVLALALGAGSTLAAAPTAPATLAAQNGAVSFKHQTHAAAKCESCHADAAGGKLGALDKEKGHALCVECHKQEAKGPTKCTDCHQKA